MRIPSIFFAATFVLGSAEGAILYEHPFPSIATPQACTSCIPQLPQLNRVWDAFDLATGAEITAIEAMLGFDASYPSSGTTAINYSIWDQTRTTELFAQDFMPAQLSITLIAGSRYDVLAGLGPVLLPAGTYYLSIFNGSQIEALTWNVTEVTVSGRSVQTLGPTFVPLPPSDSASGRDMVFRVVGESSPALEPPTMILLLAACAIAAWSLRHRLHAAA